MRWWPGTMIAPRGSRERVARIARSLGLGGRQTLVERKPTTETWRVGGNYLRVTSQRVEFETIRTFHELFAGAVRVPRLLASEQVEDRFCLVFEGLSEPVARWAAKWVPWPAYLESCADVLSRLSHVRRPMDALPRYARFESVCDALLADHESQLSRCGERERREITDFVRHGLRHHRSRELTLVHGDFGPGNLLWCADGMAVIDLASACWGDAYTDLAAAWLELCWSRDALFERMLSHGCGLDSASVDPDRLAAHLCLLHLRRRRTDLAMRVMKRASRAHGWPS